MRRVALTVGGMLAVAAGYAALAASATGLEAYRWSKRVLVLQVQRFDQVSLSQQKHILRADEAGIKSRDMVVFAVTRDAVSGIIGKAPSRPCAVTYCTRRAWSRSVSEARSDAAACRRSPST